MVPNSLVAQDARNRQIADNCRKGPFCGQRMVERRLMTVCENRAVRSESGVLGIKQSQRILPAPQVFED